MKHAALFAITSLCLIVLTACNRLKDTDFIALDAKFKITQPIIRLDREAVFEQQSPTEVIQEYFWDFGDTKTSTERTPKHIFTDIGTYLVKLKVKKADNTTKETSNKIIVLPTTTNQTNNTAQFGEKIAGQPTFTDELGIKAIFAKAGVYERYYMLGRKNSNGLYLIQTDKDRKELWSINITDIFPTGKLVPTDILYDSVPNLRKGVIIVGYCEYNDNDKDSFIISLNPSNGAKNWKYTNQSSSIDVYNSVDVVENYYVASGNSTTKNQAGSITKIKIDNFDINGVLDSSTALNAPNSEVNDAKYVRLDNENILACTETGIERPVLLRYTTGAPIKSYAGASSLNGRGLGLTKLSSGQYVLVGEVYQNNRKDSTNAFIALFDRDGVYLGMDILAMYKESFFDVVQVGNGVIVVGTHYNPLSQKDILVARYIIENNRPKRQVLRLIGGELNEEAQRIIDENGTVSILGSSQTLGNGFLDMWFMNLNAITLQ